MCTCKPAVHPTMPVVLHVHDIPNVVKSGFPPGEVPMLMGIPKS